ncbi:hypothetical protein QJS10_CPA03g01928 [Acorus calamus]|uniref:Uncharacterized protein n=1 Tax=Acorus calamus TaxID=4465 RepID=A0AAV9F986_ACOCL|nr:hypothetical protein QJS10_CPA03g01928 [Acorus calamus]
MGLTKKEERGEGQGGGETREGAKGRRVGETREEKGAGDCEGQPSGGQQSDSLEESDSIALGVSGFIEAS